MAATGFNHVSVSAPDLRRSVQFYRHLFGAEEVPAPNFGFPVGWLRVGNLQLHLFQRPEIPPTYHHFALPVDNFEELYARARAENLLDRETFGHHLYELPGNNVQMYLRDPGGNLVEVDWPDARTLGKSVTSDLRPLPNQQGGDNLKATLFLGPAEVARTEDRSGAQRVVSDLTASAGGRPKSQTQGTPGIERESRVSKLSRGFEDLWSFTGHWALLGGPAHSQYDSQSADDSEPRRTIADYHCP